MKINIFLSLYFSFPALCCGSVGAQGLEEVAAHQQQEGQREKQVGRGERRED